MIKLNEIPTNTGCYLFKDNSGKVIYVGKAKNLNKRVKSYFQKKHEIERLNILVSRINDVEFFLTRTENEAFILENNLIKKFRPKYNINLKDSKKYAYIKFTEEEFPRILIAREKEKKGRYYGPFVSSISRDKIIELLNKSFKIRTCKKLPKKVCIRYSIGLCGAPCIGKIGKEEYEEDIKSCEEILKGKTKSLKKSLFNRMKFYSSNQDYERALKIKKQIESLNYLDKRQNVERTKEYDEDIINYVLEKGKVYLQLFHSKKGILESKEDFEFEEIPDFLEDFISQYYSSNKIPGEIIIPEKPKEDLIDYLNSISNKKVKITKPKKGYKKELLDLVLINIKSQNFKEHGALEELKEKLNLTRPPKVIECFDISHLSGTSTVASMVQFREGKPEKKNYRKFKIRTVEGINDYSSIREVVRRRYTRLKKENKEFPDLIIIDGGIGQLSVALKELKEQNIEIPIISIAKREEEIFIPERLDSLKLDKKGNTLKLVQSIRDEAHRFAISYNRLLRKKEIRNS